MDVNEARDEGKLAQSYLERARELRPMLAAAGDAIERGREVTPEIVDAMIERGIFRMLLPRSLGGALRVVTWRRRPFYLAVAGSQHCC